VFSSLNPDMFTCKGHAARSVYRDDDAIHSWDLCNEPRNKLQGASGNEIGDWVRQMAAVVKSIDPNHPVTVGTEGFFGPKPQGLPSGKDVYNSGSAWNSQWS
jgi:endo-1,4-beta-mannosidase